MKHLDLRAMELPDERVTSWMEANELDPDMVPADQVIDVSGDSLEMDSFVRDATGLRVTTQSRRALRVRICAKHKSRPELHGFKPETQPAAVNGEPGAIVINGATRVPLASDGTFSVIMHVNGPTTHS